MFVSFFGFKQMRCTLVDNVELVTKKKVNVCISM